MLRPGQVCDKLLSALEASEGRRRRRKRNTTADRMGLDLKRDLLEAACRADPDPEAFEAFLYERSRQCVPAGAALAMARQIIEDWRLARVDAGFRAWLFEGAPSDDAKA